MDLTTIATATEGPEYAEGRADAHDATRTLTLDAVTARVADYVQHAPTRMALGYMDRLIELHMEHDAVSAAEVELAWADHETARKQACARRSADRLRAFFNRERTADERPRRKTQVRQPHGRLLDTARYDRARTRPSPRTPRPHTPPRSRGERLPRLVLPQVPVPHPTRRTTPSQPNTPRRWTPLPCAYPCRHCHLFHVGNLPGHASHLRSTPHGVVHVKELTT